MKFLQYMVGKMLLLTTYRSQIIMNDLNILKRIILVALKEFLHKDNLLLELGVREEAISHRIAFYIEQAFEQKKYDLSFNSETIESLVIDCEYNKHQDTKKFLMV